jgi:hypothetical protein
MVNPYPNLPPAARLCRNVILRRMPKNLALANTSKSEMLRFAQHDTYGLFSHCHTVSAGKEMKGSRRPRLGGESKRGLAQSFVMFAKSEVF